MACCGGHHVQAATYLDARISIASCVQLFESACSLKACRTVLSLSLSLSLVRRSSLCASFLPLSDQVSHSFDLSVCRQDGGILKEASAGEQANRCHRQQWQLSSIRCPTSLVFASCATVQLCSQFHFPRPRAYPDAPDDPGGHHIRLDDESSLMMHSIATYNDSSY